METITSKIDFITAQFGEGTVSRDGTNIAVKCPSCGKDDQKRKFSIRLENWNCHCWVCGIKGKNLFSILKNTRGIDAATNYANNFNIKINDSSVKQEIIRKVKLPKDFLMIAPNLNNDDPDFKAVLSYLKKRGVSEQKMWYHKIGVCISGGFWNRRVIFPSFNKQLELNYYVSRSIDNSVIPKYVNAKADRKEIVFDSIRIDWQKELTLVEGVFDLVRCDNNATCLLGSYMSENHKIFEKIVSNKTPVLLALDHDAIDKTHKIASLLFNYGVSVRIMNTAGYEDVGEMTDDEFCKRAKEADNYTGDTKISFLIDSIRSGSVF